MIFIEKIKIISQIFHNLKVPSFLLMGFLQISLPSAMAAVKFVDISGEWEVVERADLIYILDGKFDLKHEEGTNKVTIKQTGFNISYRHCSGCVRTGKVTGTRVAFDGVAFIPTNIGFPITITENSFKSAGDINPYQTRISVRGIRRVKGFITDPSGIAHPFSIVSRSVSLFKRTGFSLTFDDGPVLGSTDKIINTLKNYTVNGEPVRAGFFMVGDPNFIYFMPEIWVSKGSVRKNSKIPRRAAAAGHLVGNHSQHHARFLLWRIFGFRSESEFVKDEIISCDRELAKSMGKMPLKIFRPPYLQNGDAVSGAASELGYKVILGETVGDSEPFITVEEVNRKALARLDNWDREEPCILIFHDGRPTTYENLSDTLDFLQSRGFRLCHFDPKIIPTSTVITERKQN
jgi:peptidoglycan/xylan/chitin deacetylase (PgdA/CDA1 family)